MDRGSCYIACPGPDFLREVNKMGINDRFADLELVDITAAAATLNVNCGAVAGTATASKAVILDANKAVDEVNTAKLSIGATGSEVEVTATPA
jgi:hypothetical protein